MINQYYLWSNLPLASVLHIQFLPMCTYIRDLSVMEVQIHFLVGLYVFYLFVCVCVCVHCACRYAHVHVTARGWHQMSSLVIFHLSFWDWFSHWTWSSWIWLDCVAFSSEDLPVTASPALGFHKYRHCHTCLFTWVQADPMPGPHVYVATTLPTETSPQISIYSNFDNLFFTCNEKYYLY